MVYAVQGQFAFRNAARRDAVMQNTQTRLAAEVTWGETVALPDTSSQGDPAMVVDVRFTTDAARDQFWVDVVAFMGSGPNGPVTGSYIQQHDCPHDEAVLGPCTVSERIDY